MSRKKIVYGLVIASVCSIIPEIARATVYDMGGTGSYGKVSYAATGSDTCTEGSVQMDCQGWSWIWYEYVGGAEFEGREIQYTPEIHGQSVYNDGKRVMIRGDCAKNVEGAGFYHLGRNAYGDAINTFYTQDDNYRALTQWGDFRYVTSSGKWGHRETYSIAYLAGDTGLWNGWAGSKDKNGKFNYERNDEFAANYGVDTKLSNSNLYHVIQAKDSAGNWKDVYKAKEYRTTSEVLAEYRRLTEEDSGTARDMPLGNWGFCSANDVVKIEQTYSGSAGISVNDESTDQFLDTSGNLSGNIATAESGGAVQTYHVSTPKVRVKAFAKTWATGDAEFYNTNFTVYSNKNGAELDHKTYANNNATAAWSGTDSYQTVDLIPGVTYTLCAVNKYSTNYNSRETPNFSGEGTAEACVNVIYDVDCADFLKADGTKHTVGEHENYGRMKISGKGDLSVGDGASSDTADYWVTKENAITLSYYGCMGVQAARDGGGSDEEVVYEIDNNISPLYLNTNNYVASNSHANQSIGGYELNIVGAKWAANGINTLADRINTNYQFGGDSSLVAKTSAQKTATGNQYLKTMSWPKKDGSTKSVSITVKNPYNYYLNPGISNVDSGKLTLGSTISANVSVVKSGRANEKLGVSDSSSDVDYKTNTTIARAWLVSLPSSVTQGSLNDALGSGTTKLDGDYFYVGGSDVEPINRLSSMANSIESKDLNIDSSTTLERTISDNEEVGSKLCIMSAVWPADSHNILPNGEDYTIKNSDDQSNALMGDNAGNNAYWRFEVNCQTVGKYPNISVEGASLVANGEVSTATIKYNSGIFGSWTEYDLIANGAKNIGSGASLAYANAYTKKDPNDAGDFNVDGGRGSSNYYPQSVGNKDGSNSSSDASEIYRLSSKFADSLISYCGDSESTSTGECTFANSVPDDGNGIYVYNGGFPIADNIINKSKNAIMVIVGDDVTINNNVAQVDAIIIARKSFDTCAGHDRNEADGNQDLHENCNNQLVINGAVKTAGGVNLKLDRTFGGGSMTGEDKLNPSALMQRAEIFNYDPRIVKVSQDIWEKTDATNVQYVRELAPRL